MPPVGVRMPVPLSFKLPLTAKSVTVLLFFDFRPSHAMAIVRWDQSRDPGSRSGLDGTVGAK